MKLGLGTAQFGLEYGISNRRGRTPPAEVVRILALAGELGIELLDTAPAYGDSESVLGTALAAGQEFRFVTKTPAFDARDPPQARASKLEQSLRQSLARLGRERVYALLFHQAADLLDAGGALLMERARACQERGWIAKVGVSVYSKEELDSVRSRHRIDLVQAPVNVLDQRLLRSGHLRALHDAGVEVHARSVFLQGLLLMAPVEIPPGLAAARTAVERFQARARAASLTPLQAALGFVYGLEAVDVVLCGVSAASELADLAAAAQALPGDEFGGLAIEEAAVLNPTLWRVPA